MLTRFISDKSYDSLNVEYLHDSNIKIKSVKVGVDGNLNYTIVPTLSDARDLKINNYVLNILSRNDKMSDLFDLEEDNKINNKMCVFYSIPLDDFDYYPNFWKFETNCISVSTNSLNYGDANIFEIDIIDNDTCRIYHDENRLRYILAYSLSLSTVKAIPLTANNLDKYTTDFNYILNDKKITLYVQSEMGNFILKEYNDKLVITLNNELNNDDNFNIARISDLNEILNQNNWVSYKNTFNANNLNISENKSHFDIKNNFLLTTTIGSIISSLPINILTLKNQLNQENDQSRGGVFLDENETSLKEYESIFTGGYRELGYDKINLGYTIYSTPFVFKSGKTTYFHVPHDIYPYKKLNINSSKLTESGAIGGNSPLNSDKIWKKIRNYRDTSPYSNPHEEQTGQWYCTWLSAGNPDTKPVWMDRYYKPSKITPFTALSAISNEIIYIDGFNCLDLKENISDVKSNLTFEKGSYYAYMHLGKNDYINLITESLSSKIYYENLDEYQGTNFKNLVAIDDTYYFNGNEYGYIDSSKKFDYNNATFSFVIEKDDWNIPTGNMIFGNYVNNGFGFYNYNFNTPYSILKLDDNTLQILNNNFAEINNLTTINLTLCGIAGISRINGFENIHAITKDFRLIEFDLKGTIVDSNSAIIDALSIKPTDKIYSITNDLNNCYVHTSSGVASINLFTNNVTTKIIKKTINTGYTLSSFIIADDLENIYRFYGSQAIFRNGMIYGTGDNGYLSAYSTALDGLSSWIKTSSPICCFNIDNDDSFNIITTSNELCVYDKNRNIVKTLTLSGLNTYSLSAKVFNFCEKFESGVLKNIKQIYCENVSTNDSYILQIDENDNQEIIKLNQKYKKIQENIDLTNFNFNRAYLKKYYNDKTYNFKARLLNRINHEDFTELNFIINSEDLATGMRHFVFTIDSYNGIADFYLDGQLYESKKFEKGKYALSNTFNGRIFYGSTAHFNGIPAFQTFKDVTDFTYGGIKIKNNYILNKFLNRFETLYFYNLIYPSKDLKYNMPSGTRSFIDKLEKTFNFNIPMFKSNYFNLKILNSGIGYDDIKEEIENNIRMRIAEYLPAHIKLNNFEWLNAISDKITIEGDYNVSNTLTNI